MGTTRIPPDSAQPLRGIRVVEIGLYHAGPTATRMLAALGAEVIKVEDPRSPDPVRAIRRVYGQDCTLPGGRSVLFEAYNANKKAVTLSLTHPEGLRLLQQLVAGCDVFLHNMRADTAARLKIDYASLLAHNPRLVYACISGFGPEGPEATRPGLDPVGLARSGLMSALSGGSGHAPMLPATSVCDRVAGMVTGYAILAALLARDRTGEPQRVDSSLLGSAMWLGELNLQYALFTGRELLPTDQQSDPLLSGYQCADGRWIFIAALGDAGWQALGAGLGLPEMAGEPRFATPEARWDNRSALAALLAERFASVSSDDWLASFARQPDLVFERVNRPQDVGQDPQVLANGYVVEVDDPDLGSARRMAFPLHVNGQPAGRVGPAPAHGEHNAEVLGLDADQLARLREQGVM